MSRVPDGGLGQHKPVLDPELLLRAYAAGLFPMADSRTAPDVFWVEPKRRGVLPLAAFHLPRSLAKTLRHERYLHTTDLAFEMVVRNCAAAAPGREESWINAPILAACVQLFRAGHAHSIEVWDRDGRLAGGLYGVVLGAAFFGESMFSRQTDSSKAALAHLVARLRCGGFQLLDTQFRTAHLARFGGTEIRRADYARRLTEAIRQPADWWRLGGVPPAHPDDQPSHQAAAQSAVFAPELLVPELLLPPGVLAGAGPSGNCIVQLLSQTS